MLKIRTVTDATRLGITPEEGEPVYTSDTKRWYVGDGSTVGGVLVGPSAGGGAGGITVQDEGTPLATDATTLNFVGAGVAATGSGATKTITITGSGAAALDDLSDVTITTPSSTQVLSYNGSAWVNAAAPAGGGVTVQDEGTPLSTTATTLNFVGSGVTASGSGATKTITITGGGAAALDDLSDVTITSAASNDGLVYNGSAWVDTPIVTLTGAQTVEDKRLKDTAQIVQAISNPAAIDLNNGNVLTYTMSGNMTFNITGGIQSAGNSQVAEFWLTGNYTPTFQVNGNAVTFVNGSPGAQTGGATYLYAIKLNGSANVVGFNAAGSGVVGNLDSLTDVVITTPASTQVLTYNGTNWVNAAAPSGSGGITWFQVTPSGGAATVNMTNGNGAYATMTQDTTFSITNWPAGEDRLVVELTGNYTPTFSGVTFPGGNPGAQSVSPTTYVIYSRNDGSTKVGSIAVGPAASGSGDVTAASAFGTDNRLVRSDGTGKGVQASGITIDDSNNVSGVGTLNGATLPSSGTIATVGQSYATVQEEGSALTQRATLNFIGAGVTAVDNAGQTRTDVTIAATKVYAEPSIASTISLTPLAWNEITINSTGHTVQVAAPSANSTVETTVVKVIQGSGGSKTVTTWQCSTGPVAVTWVGGAAPTLKTVAADWDLISISVRKNSGGTVSAVGTWIGASS